MKKVIACILSALACAALFLLLPHLLSAPPEMGTQPLGLVYFVFPAAALLYGCLLPFISFDDKYIAVIEGAIFIVFAWMAGCLISMISLIGTAIYTVLMLVGALVTMFIRNWFAAHIRH